MADEGNADRVERAIRQERERSREREIVAAQKRGEEKARQESINKDHAESITELKDITTQLKKSHDSLEKQLGAVEKSFGEFAAVAKALAENGVTTKTFLVSLGFLLIAIIGLFLGVAHP